jgi:hypothetical protein
VLQHGLGDVVELTNDATRRLDLSASLMEFAQTGDRGIADGFRGAAAQIVG